jgi:hypothetical protein
VICICGQGARRRLDLYTEVGVNMHWLTSTEPPFWHSGRQRRPVVECLPNRSFCRQHNAHAREIPVVG